MPRNRDSLATLRARKARQNRSAAEAFMWSFLRNAQLGFKFRREHPLGPYRLDFFCPEALLAMEMDGEQHDASVDGARDREMARLGIRTYRVLNTAFFGLNRGPHPEFVSEIRRLCEARTGRKAFPER